MDNGRLGGPAGLEKDLRALGDRVTEMDRIEDALSEGAPGDVRDTSTPRAFAADLRKYVLGDALPADDRALLTGWLRANTTGDDTIRAGVPAGWVVGDKTGTGGYFEVELRNPPTVGPRDQERLDIFLAAVRKAAPRTRIVLPEYLTPYTFRE